MRALCPPGHALAVDRVEFSRLVARAIEQESRITIHREEVTALDPEQLTIVATGPLTSGPLCSELARLTGSGQLAFYDSISPIVEADSIDMERVLLCGSLRQKAPPITSTAPCRRRNTSASTMALVAAGSGRKAREWEKARIL